MPVLHISVKIVAENFNKSACCRKWELDVNVVRYQCKYTPS